MTEPGVALSEAEVRQTTVRRTRLGSWLFTPVPLGRVAAFRTAVYAYVVMNTWFSGAGIRAKGDVSTSLYVPLRIARILWFIPDPTHHVANVAFWALLVLGPIAATGRVPRLAGVPVFLLYFQWTLIANSYGKVDHDQLGILLALASLPTIGRARHGETARSEAAGWAFRMVQMGVIATYFLAAYAKIRFGGIEWLWEGTLAWAVLRRGTYFSRWTLDHPLVLQVTQFAMVGFEALSPLIFFLKEKTQYKVVAGFYLFHVITLLGLSITFTPHQFAMLAFLPLERVRPTVWLRALAVRVRSVRDVPLGMREGTLRSPAGHPVAVAGDPPVDGPGDPSDRREGE